jgi:hypothetical protein
VHWLAWLHSPAGSQILLLLVFLDLCELVADCLEGVSGGVCVAELRGVFLVVALKPFAQQQGELVLSLNTDTALRLFLSSFGLVVDIIGLHQSLGVCIDTCVPGIFGLIGAANEVRARSFPNPVGLVVATPGVGAAAGLGFSVHGHVVWSVGMYWWNEFDEAEDGLVVGYRAKKMNERSYSTFLILFCRQYPILLTHR